MYHFNITSYFGTEQLSKAVSILSNYIPYSEVAKKTVTTYWYGTQIEVMEHDQEIQLKNDIGKIECKKDRYKDNHKIGFKKN